MGNGNDCTLVLVEVLFQPVYAFCVEVVGGLVEQQYVGLLQQQTAQGNAASFSTAQRGHFGIGGGAAQGGHGAFQLAVQIPGVCTVNDVLQLALACEELVHLVLVLVVFGQSELLVNLFIFGQRVHNVLYAFLYGFHYGLLIVQLGVLFKIAYRVAGAPHYVALIALLNSGNDLHQGGLTGSVQTDDAYLGSVKEAQVNVL